MTAHQTELIQVGIGIAAYLALATWALATLGPRIWRRVTLEAFHNSIAYHEREAARLLHLAKHLDAAELGSTNERDRAAKHIDDARRRRAELDAFLNPPRKETTTSNET